MKPYVFIIFLFAMNPVPKCNNDIKATQLKARKDAGAEILPLNLLLQFN